MTRRAVLLASLLIAIAGRSIDPAIAQAPSAPPPAADSADAVDSIDSIDQDSVDPIPSSASSTSAAPIAYRVRVSPDTVTVGDEFRVAVFVDASAGAEIELVVSPDSLGRYQTVGATRVYPPDSAGSNGAGSDGAGSSESHRAVATMVAWTTGAQDSARATVRVSIGDSIVSRSIRVPLPFVRSVLPADTSQHRPKAAKDVYGPAGDWRVAALLAVAALLTLVLLFLVFRAVRRWLRREPAPVDPREAAVERLERARAAGLAEAGEWKAFYTEVSGALRDFAASTDTWFGAELTTAELVARMRQEEVPDEDVRPLAEVLRTADLAKFARHAPGIDRARADWAAARAWVDAFDWEPPEEEDEEEIESDEDLDEEETLAEAGPGGRERGR